MGTVLFHAHSGLRYLVLLLAVLALLALLWNRYGGGAAGFRRGALAAFNGALDLQVLLGLILLFVRPFFGALAGHITMMVLALVSAHVLAARSRKAGDAGRSFALALAGVIVPLVLIVGGILAIGRAVL